MRRWFTGYTSIALIGLVLAVSLSLGWILYSRFGHFAISTIYNSEPHGIHGIIMKNRRFTPLQDYYDSADQVFARCAIWLTVSYICLVALYFLVERKILGKALMIVCSSLTASFGIFVFFEIFPGLIRPIGLDFIPYYAYKDQYVADDRLVKRNRPFRHIHELTNFRGDLYSSAYGIEVPAEKYESAMTDEDGFISWMSKKSSAIVVVGDSYMEFALRKGDDFGSRLENHVGLSVASLTISGSGPIQYLEIFKRYGLRRKPKYAIFPFFEGNDIWDIKQYLNWERGEDYWQNPPLSRPLFTRYLAAMEYLARHFNAKLLRMFKTPTSKRRWLDLEYEPRNAFAEVQIGPLTQKMDLIWYTYPRQSVETLLASIEWQELRRVLKEFKDVCVEQGIYPLLLNIPSKTRVYAKYSTERSGSVWLQMRSDQIAATQNREKAILQITKSINLDTVNLTTAFDLVARSGKVLFYPLGSHWNSAGREVAASVVAEKLKRLL